MDDICASWNFKQVIPCHFAAPVRAGPAEFRRAFTFAYELAEQDGLLPPKPAGVCLSYTVMYTCTGDMRIGGLAAPHQAVPALTAFILFTCVI